MQSFEIKNGGPKILIAYGDHHGWDYKNITGAPQLSPQSQNILRDNTSYFLCSVPGALAQDLCPDHVSSLPTDQHGNVHFCFCDPPIVGPSIVTISAVYRNQLVFNLLRFGGAQEFVDDFSAPYNAKRNFFQGLLIYCRDNQIELPEALQALNLFTTYGVDLVRPRRHQLAASISGDAGGARHEPESSFDGAESEEASDLSEDSESPAQESSRVTIGGLAFRFFMLLLIAVPMLWAIGGYIGTGFSLWIGQQITQGIADLVTNAFDFLPNALDFLYFNVAPVSFPPEAYLGMAIAFATLLVVGIVELAWYTLTEVHSEDSSVSEDDDNSEEYNDNLSGDPPVLGDGYTATPTQLYSSEPNKPSNGGSEAGVNNTAPTFTP